MQQLKEIEFQQNKKLINLYRKNRNKELQKKIDKIFSETDNTTLRIKLIEKLDEEYESKEEKQNLPPQKENQLFEKKENLKSSSSINFETEKVNEVFSKIKGVFQKIINVLGLNQEIKKFASQSNNLLNYSFAKCNLNRKIINFFSEVPERKVLDILKIFDYLQKEGWLFWDPYTYNYVYNLNLFLNEFFKMKFVLNDDKNNDYISLTENMQRYYAIFLNEDVDINIIKNEVSKTILNNNELSMKQDLISDVFYYITKLEKRNLKLTNIMQAFYICEKKEMIHWSDIVKILNPDKIESKFYTNKNNAILKKINLRVLKVKNSIKEKQEEQDYIRKIKNDYFKIENGNVCVEFIEDIVLDYVNSYYIQEVDFNEMKNLYMSNPMHLLNIVLNYLVSNYFSILLESSVKLLNPIDKKTVKVKILENNIFDADFEKIKVLQKSIDQYFKENVDTKYSFEDLSNRKITEDGRHLTILNLTKESTQVFYEMAEKIREILKSHFEYLSNSLKNKTSNKFSESYYESIKKITNKPKLIPYYNFLITNKGNLFEETIEYSFEYLVKLLYNFCYLYKNYNISKMFDERYVMEERKSLQDLYDEYLRLTQKEYTNE